MLQPILMVYPKCKVITFVTKLEEPYEGRLSRTVPWEREGEIPSRDPIMITIGPLVMVQEYITIRIISVEQL